MKVPEYVKQAIIKASKYFVLAHKNNDIVRNWLDNNDLVEYGIGGGQTIIKQLEELEVK